MCNRKNWRYLSPKYERMCKRCSFLDRAQGQLQPKRMKHLQTHRRSQIGSTLLTLGALLLSACAGAQGAGAALGAAKEVGISYVTDGPNDRTWTVGGVVAKFHRSTRELSSRFAFGCTGNVQGSTWTLLAHEANGQPWRASCDGSAFMLETERDLCSATVSEPTAAQCAIQGLDPVVRTEGFRLELNAVAGESKLGRVLFPSGVIAIERGTAAQDPFEIPSQFVLKAQGMALALLQTRPSQRLQVRADLDASQQRAMERAALLILVEAAQTGPNLRGISLYPPAWAQSSGGVGAASATP